MDTFMNAAAVQRLERYFQQIGAVLGEESRRGSFALLRWTPSAGPLPG
ncbi:IS4 family transposase [Corallococcus macrosporus]|uniref:IS4 family transposase n=1 Tax=Myxococcus fulvus (strain ATCC BAA-855 / HW-1) TaxID=483219 RepID=F8CFU3_MYXFH|nr:IS4 family transposase [Corallococcus macrosporus]